MRATTNLLCSRLLRLAAAVDRRRFSSCNSFSQLLTRSQLGDHHGFLSLFVEMSKQKQSFLNKQTFLLFLKASSALQCYKLTATIHGQVLKLGFCDNIVVVTALIGALCKCEDVASARFLFDEMCNRDIACWNAMLSGYARNDCVHEALELFRSMCLKPNSLTLSVLLKVSCYLDDMQVGRSVHAYICRHSGFKFAADTFLYNSLIVYYKSCGCIDLAENLFTRLLDRDIVSWNALISGYVQNNMPWAAIDVFQSLREDGVQPDHVTFETVLHACGHIGNAAKSKGLIIHALQLKAGVHLDVYSDNSVLLMYCKCGDVDSGQYFFSRMEEKNLVSWSILINGYVRVMYPEKAIDLFKSMRYIEPGMSSDVLVSTLHAFKQIALFPKQIMSLHGLAIILGFGYDAHIISSLISAYGDCSEVTLAHRCLDSVERGRRSSTICLNAMLSVYVRHGYFCKAIDLMLHMQVKSCSFDTGTLVNALSICIQQQDLKSGKVIHAYIIRNNFESDVFLGTSLMELYSRCGLINSLCWLFSKMPHRNLISWNALIHGCLQNGYPRLSLKLFHLMHQQDGYTPDATSLVGFLEAVAKRGYQDEANYAHKYLLQSGFINNDFVSTSLIRMHFRFHDFDKANMVFDRTKNVGSVMWNTMIAEYAYKGQHDKALSLFCQMKSNNIKPDSVTVLCLLKACITITYVLWAHANASKLGHASNIAVGTALLDLYAKGGDLSTARLVFDTMESKNVETWNSMLCAYALHGLSEEANNLFIQMHKLDMRPTAVTFLILISACSHSGDIKKGQYYFELMTRAYSYPQTREHTSSFVDLLGRKGLAKDAYIFLKDLPAEPGEWSWSALLQSCRIHGHFEIGLAAAERLLMLDPSNYGHHVLVSNMFAEAGRWSDASMVRTEFERTGFRTVHGWSKMAT